MLDGANGIADFPPEQNARFYQNVPGTNGGVFRFAGHHLGTVMRGRSSSAERPPDTREVAGAAPAGPTTISGLMRRLLARVVVTPEGCWEWSGSRTKRGYGMISIGGRLHRTHRLAYEESVGPIEDGLLVCHRCDNPPCLRPDHLFVGTSKDNKQDAVAKGRDARKLSDMDAMAIIADPRSMRAIAREYGVSAVTIVHIKHGKRWKHLAHLPRARSSGNETGDAQ